MRSQLSLTREVIATHWARFDLYDSCRGGDPTSQAGLVGFYLLLRLCAVSVQLDDLRFYTGWVSDADVSADIPGFLAYHGDISL